ncbi:MAG: polysaccharide biosynthesis C-terminal domain-containing protein, partial [Saprospiraceae bacterium]|nr:polysaccharide biosynthesis C-terminal domain-containing protein [Saprospiraceae bacterium]
MERKIVGHDIRLQCRNYCYSKYYKFNFYLQLFVALICIVTNYYFISEYGLNGAAISGLICLIIYNLARYFYVKLKMNMHPFSKSTIKSILVFALALTISWLIGYFIKINIDGHTYYSIGLNLFIKSGIWSILFMSLLYFIKPSEDIRLFFEVIKGKFVKPHHRILIYHSTMNPILPTKFKKVYAIIGARPQFIKHA